MTRVNPPKLKPGDLIAIAATARKIAYEELEPAIHVFESWGLRVLLHPRLFDVDHQFAGTALTRSTVFNDYLHNPDVRAIVCARGGYGTVRMVDGLDIDVLQADPKWIVGYSDVTVLHNHIHQHTNINTLHGTMPINMQAHNANAASIEALRKVLMTDDVQEVRVDPHPLNRFGEAEGELVGGNLSVIYSLLGSRSDINTDGKLLFIEDLDEYLYHIDRMMQAMKRSGKLRNIKGLIIGGMSDMKDNTVPFGADALAIIAKTVEEYSFPVLFNYPAGHIDVNLSLTIGGTFKMSVNQYFSNFVRLF
jgi:muramoyltetrapeptide carboxypeptidase